MSRTTTGIASAIPAHRRRVMSASSGWGRSSADHTRFERHAADRARARADLAHLRMHRAGVDRALPASGLRLRTARGTCQDRPRNLVRQPLPQK